MPSFLRLSFLLCMCSAVAHADNTPTSLVGTSKQPSTGHQRCKLTIVISYQTHDHTADVDPPLRTQKLTKRQTEEEDDDVWHPATRIEFEKGLKLPDCDVHSLSLPEWLDKEPKPLSLDDNNGLPVYLKKCKEIGEGLNANVYPAMNVFTNELVAIKVFKSRSSDEVVRKEVRNLEGLHKFLGRYEETLPFSTSKHAIVIPFVRGIPLARFKLSDEQLKETLGRLARHVIAKLLSQGFIHTDLHFNNVMVSKVDDDQLIPSNEDDAMTAIDFGSGYYVNINEDISKDVLHAIHVVLWAEDKGGRAEFNFRRQFGPKKFNKPIRDFVPWTKEDGTLDENVILGVVKMMYGEIKEGCPECNIPEIETFPKALLEIHSLWGFKGYDDTRYI